MVHESIVDMNTLYFQKYLQYDSNNNMDKEIEDLIAKKLLSWTNVLKVYCKKNEYNYEYNLVYSI